MPSTYTTNGGIELPANGEQSATWGNTVNDNMNIVDRLTNGIGAITLSGTTHTLTTSNGALSDGQYSVLVLGGSPSGTNTVTVSPNDGQHIYIVKNGSGQTATFTQGSGANVSVLTGTTKIIYCDGAGSGAAVVDITGSLDLGSLILGGTAVTATAAELNIMDGVTATTAELNILDGVTATTAELNILDGVTLLRRVEYPRRCHGYYRGAEHPRWVRLLRKLNYVMGYVRYPDTAGRQSYFGHPELDFPYNRYWWDRKLDSDRLWHKPDICLRWD